MAQVPVLVQVDFTNVSYSNGTWTGTPTWNVPGKVSVHPGDNTVVWRLNATQVPNQFGALFPATGAIDFSNSDPAWPGSTPTLQTNATYSCTDNFTAPQTAVDYEYSVTVSLVPNAGTNGVGTSFTKDPDVENESS